MNDFDELTLRLEHYYAEQHERTAIFECGYEPCISYFDAHDHFARTHDPSLFFGILLERTNYPIKKVVKLVNGEISMPDISPWKISSINASILWIRSSKC